MSVSALRAVPLGAYSGSVVSSVGPSGEFCRFVEAGISSAGCRVPRPDRSAAEPGSSGVGELLSRREQEARSLHRSVLACTEGLQVPIARYWQFEQ
jgi:hypothetical protein